MFPLSSGLKCDISKYFYNIKHDALKSLIRKYISDPDCLWLLDMIIDSTEGNVGIPIGNQSSQLFALLYLSSLDHMIKEKLGIKFYGRYMDDFYLIHEDKEYLRYCWKEIERHVNELGLSLNAKTNIYPLKNGIDFLGFHSYLTESGAVIRKVCLLYTSIMKHIHMWSFKAEAQVFQAIPLRAGTHTARRKIYLTK